MRPNKTTGKRLMTPRDLDEEFGVGIIRQRKMRARGVGPEFVRAGYRTIYYRREKVLEWIASLPSGGGQAPGRSRPRKATGTPQPGVAI
jgi:hypothetical protein